LARLHAGLQAHGAAGLRALQPAECAAWVRPEFDRAAQGVGANVIVVTSVLGGLHVDCRKAA
jgi:hypothetical protein